jgi:hypothetical protein
MPTAIPQGRTRPDGPPEPGTPGPSQSSRTPVADLIKGTYGELQSRHEQLKDQLEDMTERREELSQQIQQKSGNDRAGLETRLGVLDQRLIDLEADLNVVGRQVALTAPAAPPEPNTRIEYRGYDDEAMFAAGFTGAGLMLALFVPFLIRSFWRRRKVMQPMAAQPAIGAERIDRMEQAIDSIAVEIERVSENQRFMTRLMTETQLAGSIAAVRGSTEVAKAAAEGPAGG